MTMEHELVILRDQIHAKKAETERELKKKERMEKEIKELKMSLESKQNEIKSKQQTVLDGQEQVEKSEHQLREQKQLADKVQKDLDSANQKVTKLQSDLEDQIHTNTQLLAENSQKQVELKIKEDEIQAVKAEVVRVNKIREATILKLKAIEKTKEESENEKEELRNEIQSLGRDMEAQRKIAEQERKRQEELLRERDVLNKLKTQAENSIEKQSDLVKINEVAIHNLEAEIQNYRDAAQKQEKLINQLEKERQKYGAEASQAGVKYMQIEKEREALKQELSKSHQQIKDAEVVIASHVVNIENMNHIISEADDERFRQKKELDVIKNERDILGTQLIRRNEELSLLYEKIKIQQSTLSKGQVQYRYRLNELRLLKIKLTELKREHCVLKGSVQNIYVLKQEIHNLGRELLQERTKVKALSEELENPLNVHRWRQLEGTDPTAYEMILKIQTLQKRLILKTEQVVEKDLLIQEKEKLYVELRSILARQPGPEVAEQLGIYAKNLKEKNRQMQAMASELHMYQGQVKELKGEIQRLNAELDTVKLKFYEKKRKEQQERQKKRDLDTLQNSITPDSNGTPQPKILGGGFNMG